MSDITLAQADFQIPAPKTPAAPAPSQPPSPPDNPALTLQIGVGNNGFSNLLSTPIPTSHMVIGAAVFLVLCILFFMIKLVFTRSLQDRYAAPGAASAAGWFLFVWLAVSTLVLIVLFVGNFWTVYLVSGPAAGLSLVLLLIFLGQRGKALKTRR